MKSTFLTAVVLTVAIMGCGRTSPNRVLPSLIRNVEVSTIVKRSIALADKSCVQLRKNAEGEESFLFFNEACPATGLIAENKAVLSFGHYTAPKTANIAAAAPPVRVAGVVTGQGYLTHGKIVVGKYVEANRSEKNKGLPESYGKTSILTITELCQFGENREFASKGLELHRNKEGGFVLSGVAPKEKSTLKMPRIDDEKDAEAEEEAPKGEKVVEKKIG